jgi:membrane protein
MAPPDFPPATPEGDSAVVHDGQPADNAAVEHARGGPSPPPDTVTPGTGASNPAKARTWRDKGAATVGRIKTGSVGTFWSRLNAVDFMNSALMFAGLFLVCFFPFLAVVDAATGRNTQKTITDRLGLNAQAAHDVDALISTGHQTVSALSVLGAIVLVLFAVGIPGVLQAWYEKVYDQSAPYGGLRQFTRKVIWVALFLAYIWLEALVGQQTGPAGGHLLTFVCEFVIAVLFWWGTVHFLLDGRIGWRVLLPTALATGFCLTGLAVFSLLLFSGSVISGEKSYGPIGVVLVLLYYLIGAGVCLLLGAVFGRTWNESHQSPGGGTSSIETVDDPAGKSA